MFRNTRSLSGTYSAMINFTVADFLSRSQKISILNRIKYDHLSERSDAEYLSFPIHHKHKHDNHLSSIQNLDDVDQIDIDDIILDSYDEAIELVKRLEIARVLQENRVIDLNSLSGYVFQKLNSSCKMFDYSTPVINHDDDNDEFDLDEDEEEENNNNEIINQLDDDEQMNDDTFFDQEDDDYDMKTIRTNFNGMKIFDEIDISQRASFFKIKTNDNQRYVHKQSACWILTDKTLRLSNDRLSRVIQSSRKDKNDHF